MASSRSTVRKALAAALAQQLAGDAGPAEVVFDHLPGDFGGRSPAIAVGARGSKRERLTLRGSRATFAFDVYIFVLASDPAADWTEADAEDAIDAIELGLAELLDTDGNTAWSGAAYADMSETDYITIGGDEYRRERIPLVLMVAS